MKYRLATHCRGLCVSLVAVLGIALGSQVQAAADVPADGVAPDAAAAQPVEQLHQLAEIRVYGRHLADRIASAEDRFFGLYNTVNHDGAFRITCGYMTFNASELRMDRSCLPHFATNQSYYVAPGLRGASCGDFGNYLVGATPQVGIPSGGCEATPRAVAVYIDSRRAAYADHVMQVIRSDPRLLDMAQELAGMYSQMSLVRGRYAEVQQAQHADHPR